MAKIQEEIIVIKLSKLIKDESGVTPNLTDEDFAGNIEAVVQELVGNTVVVEVEKAL